MHVPTVRVRNPAEPSTFMTVNQADLTDAHDLWPVQAPGYVLIDKVSTMSIKPDEDERDLAASLMTRTLADHYDLQLADYMALPVQERMEKLRDAERQFEDASKAASARRTAAFEAFERPIYENGASPAVDAALSVRKGPRGLWFVHRGEERIGGGHATEDAARAAMAGASQ